jgi:uracil-DNA glycosylase
MDVESIKSAFSRLDEPAKDLCVRDLKDVLIRTFNDLTADMIKNGKNKADLSPAPNKIFNAFVETPPDNIRVVLIGQDPYINEGEANGLAFSTESKKTPPSLRNINECLKYYNLGVPPTNSLVDWCRQGVLLLNTALTTYLHQSAAHEDIWREYTDKLISNISQKKHSLIWILLGGPAQKKAKLIDVRRHTVLTWGHPSPLSPYNKSDNPKHFKYCDVFIRTNELLKASGGKPIVWGVKNDEVVISSILPATLPNIEAAISYFDKNQQPEYTGDTLYVFTDGGATGNGKSHCKASWAFCTVGKETHHESGLVENVDIPGVKYKTSNQRAELTAILNALKYVKTVAVSGVSATTSIIIVSDSDYSMKCITKWFPKWSESDKLEKKNVDLITEAVGVYNSINQTIQFKHIRSHQQKPTGKDEYFLWYYNDLVDRLCAEKLQK